MKIRNISDGKIIGIGEVTILPGESADIAREFESSPILDTYKKIGFIEIMGKPSREKDTKASENLEDKKRESDSAETLRLARLASLENISDEELGKLANELGINLASCKDQADVLKKVKAALKK
jgi:hypothetical protein|nr:MAG TPA: HeH/LEM domain [Caudoviricetes sp.]DAO80795.1 MAG TPA: HeH/LEM domain [Caudoviricetes sp.]